LGLDDEARLTACLLCSSVARIEARHAATFRTLNPNFGARPLSAALVAVCLAVRLREWVASPARDLLVASAGEAFAGLPFLAHVESRTWLEKFRVTTLR